MLELHEGLGAARQRVLRRLARQLPRGRGHAEFPKEKATPIPIWKRLVTGWKGFSQLEIADNYR